MALKHCYDEMCKLISGLKYTIHPALQLPNSEFIKMEKEIAQLKSGTTIAFSNPPTTYAWNPNLGPHLNSNNNVNNIPAPYIPPSSAFGSPY